MSARDGIALLTDHPAEGDPPLLILTEEELAAVAPADHDGDRLVPFSRLDRMDERDRLIAESVSRRSLIARGLLDDEGMPAKSLALALTLRSSPRMVAIVDRQDGGHVVHRYLYGADGDLVLEEDVEDAVHQFTLTRRRSSAGRLVTFVDPRARAPRSDGDPVVRHGPAAGSGWQDALAATGRVETVTRLFSIRPGPRSQAAMNLSVVAGAEGLVVVGGYSVGGPSESNAVTPVVSTRSLSHRSLMILFEVFLDPTPIRATATLAAPGENDA